ncbi:MAG: ergothioneine biosynthesis protein EgtB [Flavobacterium sp.]|nr:ergothioneine biosynthesis protein EgtB [Pedobacter sp.]
MILQKYKDIRQHSVMICSSLKTEDYVVQPVVDVSPPKWHLGHTTWFFETFILKPFANGYREFDPNYNYVFNSYYETIGARVIRTDRGNLSRPGVEDVYRYRYYVDEAMADFLRSESLTMQQKELLELGLNHEQQHQELLCTDIKYILGHNPLFPAYSALPIVKFELAGEEDDEGIIFDQNFNNSLIDIPEGVYEIGYEGSGFCFDNELGRHKVYLQNFSISTTLVSNQEFLEFINDGGYRDFKHWHADGWEWVKTKAASAPLYWHLIDAEWFNYTSQGLKPLAVADPLCHISYYEASAYASWKGMRLPTEFEWEIAARKFEWGKRWEWTESAYLPYPGFKKVPGAIGEYNGKFMINQMVLRGASEVTSPDHSRITYRNFFQPELRWQYTGIRLAK